VLPTARLISPFCGKLAAEQMYSLSTSVTGDTALPNSSNFGFSGRFINWFRSYLSARFSVVCTLENSSLPVPVLSGAAQGSTLEPLLLNIFINDLCSNVYFSEFLLFADDLNIFRVMKSAKDCNLLQSDIDSVQKWKFYENQQIQDRYDFFHS
jgi:hypothetical protein